MASPLCLWPDVMNAGDRIEPAIPPRHDLERPWELWPVTIRAWQARFPRLLARAPDVLGVIGTKKNPMKELEVQESQRLFYQLSGSVFRDYSDVTPHPIELGLAMLDLMEARADRLLHPPLDGWAWWVIDHAPAFMDPAEDAWYERWRAMSIYDAAIEIQRFEDQRRRLGPAIRDERPSVGSWLFHSSDPRAVISRERALKITLVAAPLPPSGIYNLEPLTGSPKQVEWGTNIRAEKWEDVEEYAWPKAFDQIIDNVARVPYDLALRRLAMTSEAKFWIDARSRSASKLVEQMAKETRIGQYPYTLDGATINASGEMGRMLDAIRKEQERRAHSQATPRPVPSSDPGAPA